MAEKSLNEITRDVRLLYQKGHDALLRENYDYALDLFMQVLEREPTLFEARRALRSTQAKRSGGGGFFKKAWSSASTSPLIAKAQYALHKDPVEALQIAEQILNADPSSTQGHRIVADAAQRLEMPKTALMSLEPLVRHSPKDKDLVIRFALTLAATGEPGRAEQMLSEIARHFPRDNDIAQALKDISARKTLEEGGYDSLAGGEGSYRDILKDEKEAVSLEQEKRVQKAENIGEKLIREYEQRLKTEPGNVKLLRSIAELYTEKKQFDRALEYYDRLRATEAGANDPTVDKAIADTKVRRYDHEIESLDPAAPDYTEKLATLNTEKLNFQVEQCQKRVERFPTDLSLRFDLGVLYFQAGRINDAIQEFQKAKQNPHRRIAAMNYLAQAFAQRKMYDLAARTLEGAIGEKVVFDDEKKELIYNLGTVLELMNKKNEAVEQFKQIYEVDIGYKDVATKVEEFYAGQ